ncbi:hypothetical protein, conserved [Trypanosoma brucei gambiense DAL972]|uniref:BRCT domain-containing protein n=1 Tax=Trypanosoma brucei gambiense (strain MHOM/CI/86/DAL972) TaxID=679716 RepID=C9ZRV2_TRYB9|nr:hypothetical protein, conserved [Trypanosoma brucei gambiense DAL972]CBH12088.1 hypothetical protein, conserved [Trypanosoma brucei gambiense DAL972]|eukprot:XP_011774371.1 hypothetical protein, conserved [Trypanosoma brucei gambiense DAL972]
MGEPHRFSNPSFFFFSQSRACACSGPKDTCQKIKQNQKEDRGEHKAEKGHRQFYMALSGHYVCFSGFSDEVDEDDAFSTVTAAPANGEMSGAVSLRQVTKLASSLGAKTQTRITKRTTILVAGRGLTRKRLVAEQQSIPVVSLRWLESHGRLPISDCRVPLLHGYVFCATQLTVDEERALTSIIESNGGTFSRTLSACISMLFVSPDWLKQFQQLQQKHGRPSTAMRDGAAAGPILPEKIRFAWATNIPVVEHTRFLSLAALQSTCLGGNSNGCDAGLSRTDFETIAELCALPSSVVGGVVPHTQVAGSVGNAATSVAGHVVVDIDNKPYRKRARDECNSALSSDDSQRAIRIVSPERQAAGSHHLSTSQKLFGTWNTSHTGSECCATGFPMADENAVLDAPPPLHLSTSGATLNPFSSVADPHPIPTNSGMTGEVRLQNCMTSSTSLEASRSNGDKDIFDFCETFFTHSRPFLQISLLGCTPPQLVDCARMAVRCRFLRTPVVTPFTDVVVVGSELVDEDIKEATRTAAVASEDQKQKAMLLAQLRDHLSVTYGIPVERIVTVGWLRECCQVAAQMSASSAHEAEDLIFEPVPLPLEKLPTTGMFSLQPLTNMAAFMDFDRQQQQLQQGKVNRAVLRPRPRNNPTNNQATTAESGGRQHDKAVTTSSKSVDDARNRYEADASLAVQKFNELYVLLKGSSDDEECRPVFTKSFFCFVENDFSRVDLNIVRALIKYGKGEWTKRSLNEWVKVLSRTGAGAGEGEKECTGVKENEPREDNITSMIHYFTSAYRKLIRAHDAGSFSHRKVSRAAGETTTLARSDKPGNVDTPSNGTRPAGPFHHVFYVVPHGNQKPSDVLLLGRNQRQADTAPARHPFRFLPSVTQDYILCSLAARHLLQPKSCFLFYRSTPTEAERLARQQLLRRGDVTTKGGMPLAPSPWLGRRRNEKAPLIGVTVYFLCLMPSKSGQQGCVIDDQGFEALTALRRVLLNCLGAAVSELCGHRAEKLVLEAVTHVVLVDVATIFLSKIPQVVDEVAGGDPSAVSDIRCCFRTGDVDERKSMDALLSRGSTWPCEVYQELLPQRLVQYAASDRVSLVGLEWLEASVAWGTFLDEKPFALPTTLTRQQPHKENRAVEGETVIGGPLVYSAVTPPATPVRETDVTLLPFSSATCHSPVFQSPQLAVNYQFDFTTPGATPARATLRTPGQQRASTPRFASPSAHVKAALVGDEETFPPIGFLCGLSRGKSNTPARLEENMADNSPSSANACTPVRRTLLLGDVSDDEENERKAADSHLLRAGDENRHNKPCDGGSVVDHGPLTSVGRKYSREVQEMPQLWDPEGSRSSDAVIDKRLALPSAAAGVVSKQHSKIIFDAPRIYIPHDVPGKDCFVAFCDELNSRAPRGNCDGDQDEAADIMGPACPQQQHLHCAPETTKVISRVQLVHSTREADILVTHQLTQRESVLAAIAAGLWVVTPKILEDCENRQCFGPLHDLSMHEWTPELLPPDAPRCTRQLAMQCRNRRLQRQATGKPLFENKYFILVIVAADASPAVTARAHSMRNVLETGGGVVEWAMCWKTGNEGTAALQLGESGSEGKKLHRPNEATGLKKCHIPPRKSPNTLLDFVLVQIKGTEEAVVGGVGCGNAFPTKEIILLIDEPHQEDALVREIRGGIVKVFQNAKEQLVRAKQEAQGKVRGELQQVAQKSESRSTAVGVDPFQQSIKCDGQSTRVAGGKDAWKIAGGFGSSGDSDSNMSGSVIRGMPHVGVLSVFKSDWVTLSIQQRRKAPLCTVNISL